MKKLTYLTAIVLMSALFGCKKEEIKPHPLTKEQIQKLYNSKKIM